MKGLIIKDLLMVKKYCLTLVVCCLLLAVVGAFSDSDSYMLNMYPTLLIGVIPMTLLSYDERDRWTQYSACLPYTRRQIVLVKYLDALILSTALAVLSLTVRLIAGRMNLAAVATNWAIGLIYVTFLLPFAFRFGTEKARIVQLFGIGFIAAVSVFLSGSSVSFSAPAVGVLAGVILALFTASFFLASAWYARREL